MVLPDDQLKELLLKNKIIEASKLEVLLSLSKKTGTSLFQTLIQQDAGYDEKIGQVMAKQLNWPFIVLQRLSISEDIFYLLPERVAKIHHAIVFGRDEKQIFLAVSDPKDTLITENISKKTGLPVSIFYATDRDIEKVLQLYRRDLQKMVEELLKEEKGKASNLLEDAPVAKIVDTLIHTAYQDQASDVHIEPEENNFLVRFRIDGTLRDILHMNKSLHDRIVTRIKVLSGLRTDEHLAAQDGKMRMSMEEENLDIRVSTLPVVDGEKVVLRLLSSNSRHYNLKDLGMNDVDLKKVTAGFEKSYGMVLSTGPTGSGKTTSIYSILKILNQREKNLMTIEDPVEYRILGANQIQVNVKTNLTFANGLRSILRQDPNIIFVGEIRDSETAGIAVNAALTGHLVFSTLHTNDAATAIPRLIDMKVEPFLVASTVNVIIAQRLVRKICESCRISYTITQENLAENIPDEIILKHYIPVGSDKEIRVYKGKGCKQCHMTGYSGRIGVFEVIEVSKKIREMIVQRADSDAILAQARAEGMTTMLDDGLSKVAVGMTTIEEVLRVTKTEFI